MAGRKQPGRAKAITPPPDAMLTQMIFGALLQRCVCVAAQLGIADLLAKKQQTAEELAVKTQTHAPSLYRVLRTLASAGVLAESGRKFKLTPMGSLLRGDAPNSQRDFAIMMGEQWQWQSWFELMYSVKTGGVAHEKVQGMGTFEYFTKHPEIGKVFAQAMTSLSLMTMPAIVEAYDFSRVRKLADIAGSHGLLLSGILRANPHLQGVLFDLPPVIKGASELLEREKVSNRVELVSGDFFKSVPAGADAYMMKHIIHDWDDERSIQILRNIRSVIPKDGRVLIIEMVIPEGNKPDPAKSLKHLMDVLMLVDEGGKERTKSEFKKLYEASGFKLTKIIPTQSPMSLVEGRPV
jgi:hypothetical protein